MKPKKKIPKNTLRYELHKTIKEGISKGTIKDSVKCPRPNEINEWLAVNCFDFFNNILLVYSAVSDLCSPTACPVMSGGPSMEYLWNENKKSLQLPAREYCEKLFEWVQQCFDNTKIFPDVFSSKPPKQYIPTITKIFKRLFRVYAHMFYSHQKHLQELNLTQQANLGFRHYYVFCREFNLLSKDDISPLEQIIDPVDKEFNLKKLS